MGEPNNNDLLFAYPTDGGINWGITPINTASTNEVLNGISCTADGLACAAVGKSFNPSQCCCLLYNREYVWAGWNYT